MLVQTQSICLIHPLDMTAYNQPCQMMGYALSKLNFEQALPVRRDVGGPSTTTMLVIANGVCLLWAILIHIRL